MTVAKLLSGGVVAAALAFVAVPASAQPENMGRNWDRGSSARDDAREAHQERAAPIETARPAPVRSRPRADPPARVSPPPPVVQQGGSRADAGRGPGGRDWNRSGNDSNAGGRDWNRSANDGMRTDAGRGPGGRDWGRGSNNGSPAVNPDRNRSYTDPDRNRSYDGRRDSDRRGDGNWAGRRDNDRNWSDRNGSYRDGYRDARRDHRRWDHRGWRNDRRYDWQRYRSANRSTFHIGVYYAPYRNYSYRRYGIGSYIDSLFFTNRYWINDPWRYRLPDVYGPYRWVRYYDDALLVDLYSGEVVDVIHDFFW